jgi:uncharacterized membrane protein YagU involved in acid resistance
VGKIGARNKEDVKMELDIVAAIISGFVATLVMTGMMTMAPMMGMPKMDMPALLGSMFGAPGSKMLGLVMHFMMGIIFGVIYAVLFGVVAGTNLILLGLIFGVAHWLIVGLMTGMMPMMHAGIRSGDVSAPGVYMSNLGGMMGFIGGLMGHVVFGLVVGIVYGLITGSFGG